MIVLWHVYGLFIVIIQNECTETSSEAGGSILFAAGSNLYMNSAIFLQFVCLVQLFQLSKVKLFIYLFIIFLTVFILFLQQHH